MKHPLPLLLATLLLPLAGLQANETREAWNDMRQFRINKEPARAFYLNYPDLASAVKPFDLTSLYESSASYQSLNGTWKFHFVDRLADRVKGFADDRFDLSSWTDMKVPLSWQMAGVDNIWYTNTQLGLSFDKAGTHLPKWNQNHKDKKSVKQTALDPRVAGVWRFPIGYYRRNFTVPSEWAGKQITLHFGGVQSGFDLYVNGKHVGYSEDSFTPAEFDVTPFLRAGENTVALEVYRWPTGALFEMQDMPQLSGINRDVLLIARPKVQIYDFAARSALSKDLRRADIDLDITVRNTGAEPSAGSVDVYLCPGADAIKPKKTIASLKFDGLKAGESRVRQSKFPVEDVQLWCPDVPNLYQWLFVVKDAGGEVRQVARADHGFRKFESIDKQLFLNGKRFLIKGVNHHDHDPDHGKAVDASWELKDLELMKQANINMVRAAHYPKDDRWYLMCNRIGMALLDEANLETHGLSKVIPAENPLYIEPGVDRMSNMVMRDRNHPSVLMWSIGNESGEIFGPTHRAMALKAKELDPTRPVHSQIGTQMIHRKPELQNTPEEIDFVTPMYGEYNQLAGYLKLEQERRPFFFCEYAHAMGNSIGDLNGMWNIIRENKERGLNGGFIWDWVDQSFRRAVPGQPGETFWTSAQDYGTEPHRGDFSLNGVTTALRTKTDKLIEVGAVYQNIQMTPTELARGSLKIENEYTGFNTDAFALNYVIEEDGAVLAQGTLPSPSIAPSESKLVTLSIPKPSATRPGSELFLTLSFTTKKDQPWAKAGHVVATRQFPLPVPKVSATKLKTGNGKLKASDSGSEFTVSGDGFSYHFDKTAVLLRKLEIGGKVIMNRGPELAFDNQPIPNHRKLSKDATYLNGMKKKDPSFNVIEKSDTMVRLSLSSSHVTGSGEGLREVQEWTILPNGVAQVSVQVTKLNGMKPDAFFPIIGCSMGLAKDLDRFEWYGRGAHDNYNDRLTGAPVSRYSLAVKDTFNPFYAVPHDHGNKEEVRWVAFRSGDQSKGVLFVNDLPQPIAVLPFTQDELKKARRPYELPDSSGADLRIAWKVRGLGNAACGSDTPEEYRLNFDGSVDYGFRIQPLSANEDPGSEARKIIGK